MGFPEHVLSRRLSAIPADSAVDAAAMQDARGRSIVVLGKPTETNGALVAALHRLGHEARLAHVAETRIDGDELVLARLDVLSTLDGIEPGLEHLSRLERRGIQVLNRPSALFAAHDKLSTALFLGRLRVPQPRTVHVRDVTVPSLEPPYVVKPRFGSWGQEVHLCHDKDQLRTVLARLREQRWFRRHGALVQSVVVPTGRDLRVVVAAGHVVGSIERRAPVGEWRTNVSLGATRLPVAASAPARALALRAVAALGVDLAGVDIAGQEPGGLRVLEVNGAVDFTPEYGPGVFDDAARALLRRAALRETQRSRRHAERVRATDEDDRSVAVVSPRATASRVELEPVDDLVERPALRAKRHPDEVELV